MVLAALTSVIWGLAFVAVKFGLESFSASQLILGGLAVIVLPAGWTGVAERGWQAVVTPRAVIRYVGKGP